MIVNVNATVNSNMLPHGPRPTMNARRSIERPMHRNATNVRPQANGAAELVGRTPTRSERAWLSTNEPVATPA